MRKEGTMFGEMLMVSILAVVVLVILLAVTAWRPSSL